MATARMGVGNTLRSALSLGHDLIGHRRHPAGNPGGNLPHGLGRRWTLEEQHGRRSVQQQEPSWWLKCPA